MNLTENTRSWLVWRYWRRQLFSSTLLATLLTLTIVGTLLAQQCPLYPSPHQRIGFNVSPGANIDIESYDAARLGAGWYHNYGTRVTPRQPGGIQHHQMVRAGIDLTRLPQILGPVVDANPGVIWILGNEPDRYGQDGLTPAQYADFYHAVYTFVKSRDPSSRIAIGGVVQPTPIRLRYLDMTLAAYQKKYGRAMPVEIWDIHNFMLPENCSWGASIPPGLDAYKSEAIPCHPTLNEHGDINTFKQQIRTFRQWMKDRGFRNYPLIISEYGILLSKYHGYDYARVRNYMLASFDFMLNTTDSQLGMPGDGNRLVQEFAWFSLNYWEFDLSTYFGLNGNLFDHDSRQIMPLGLDYANYTKGVTVPTIDLALTNFTITPTTLNGPGTVTMQAGFVNQGGIAAKDVSIRFWNGDPTAGGELLGSSPLQPQVVAGCYRTLVGEYRWQPPFDGNYVLYAQLTAANEHQDVNFGNNHASGSLAVVGVATPLPTPTATATPTPTPTATQEPTVTPGGPTLTPTPTRPTATATPTAVATLPPLTPTATATPLVDPSEGSTLVIEPERAATLTFTEADGTTIQVLFPAGAVDSLTTILLRPLTTLPSHADALAFAGRAFTLETYQNGSSVSDFAFNTPLVITVNYHNDHLGGLIEDEVMLYVYAAEQATWLRTNITLIERNVDQDQLVVSYRHAARDSVAGVASFALLAPQMSNGGPTATPTATPTRLSPPTVTPTPTHLPIDQLNQHLYLPLINGQ